MTAVGTGLRTLSFVVGLLATALLGPARGTAAEPASACAADRICGLYEPEDLVLLGGGKGVVASRLRGGGGLDYIDVKTRRVTPVDLAAIPQAPDPAYPCSGPQNEDFRSHGLSLKADASGAQRLYVVRHGGREAIEVFRFGEAGRVASLQWLGCVLLPKGFSGNSVTARRDGSFFVTSMTDVGDAPIAAKLGKLDAGQPSGAVLEWTPATGFRPLDFAPVSGPNGLELSADERRLYVTGWASKAVWGVDLNHPGATPLRLDVEFLPDNLRWADDGGLLVAGLEATPGAILKCVPSAPVGERCATAWRVLSLDPGTLAVRYDLGRGDRSGFGDASVALAVGRQLWLGENHGMDIAVVAPPHRR